MGTSKISSRIATRVGFLTWILLVSVFANAQQSELQRRVATVRSNVVAITARWDASTTESGFGIVVSVDPGKYVVATAKHLVYSEDDEKIARSVLITNDRGASQGKATILVVRTPGVDLAFITVNAPMNQGWNPGVVASGSPISGAEAWLFGVQGRFELRPKAARIRTTNASVISMDGLEGWEGSSGGPVFGTDGLLGIYLGIDGKTAGNAISLERIRREAEAAGIRWDLTPSGWILRKVAINFIRRDNLPVDISAVFTRTQEQFKIPGKHQAFAGDYALKFDVTSLRCDPQVFSISPIDSEKTINITCDPYLSGTYENKRFLMMLADLDNGSYDISMVVKTLPDSVVGFTGRAIRSTNDKLLYDLTGSGAQGLVSGTVRFSVDLRTAVVAARIGNQLINEGLTR